MRFWDCWNGPRHTVEHYCQPEGAYVLERSCLWHWPPRGGPGSDSWGPWAKHPSLLTDLNYSVTLPQQQPASCTATHQRRWAAEKEALVGQTGLEFGIILGSEICYPDQNTPHLTPSILPSGSSTVTTFFCFFIFFYFTKPLFLPLKCRPKS